MITINLLWYLSAVMMLGATMASFVTVVPELESAMNVIVLSFTGIGIQLAITAFLLKKRSVDH